MTPNNTLLKIPSPVIVPFDMVVDDEEVKGEHDDDDDVNPYRIFPAAAKMILVPGVIVAIPATAEMAAVGE